MQRILLSCFCLFVIVLLQAQVPQAFSYKVLIKGHNGYAHADKKVNLQISIISDNMDGNVVYVENHKITTSHSGIVDIEIGRGTPVYGLFSDIDWSLSPYFIKSEVDIKGGKHFNLIAVTELLSVPYAMYAGKAANAFSGDYNDLQNKPDIPVKVSDLENDAGYISNEVDGDIHNEIQSFSVSATGDTLRLTKSNWIIIPGISVANKDSDGDGVYDVNDNCPNNPNPNQEDIDSDGIGDVCDNTTLIDVDGNAYNTVEIGSQVWMKENLRTSRLNDGIPISYLPDSAEWKNRRSEAYCWYNNDSAANNLIYGKLYNWFVVTTDKLCPIGWHVPNDDDWNTLIDFLGGLNVAGGKMKEEGVSHWKSPNINGTNESGFTGLPSGWRYAIETNTDFTGKETTGLWWNQSEQNNEFIRNVHVQYSNGHVSWGNRYRWAGLPVRCVKD